MGLLREPGQSWVGRATFPGTAEGQLMTRTAAEGGVSHALCPVAL